MKLVKGRKPPLKVTDGVPKGKNGMNSKGGVGRD